MGGSAWGDREQEYSLPGAILAGVAERDNGCVYVDLVKGLIRTTMLF